MPGLYAPGGGGGGGGAVEIVTALPSSPADGDEVLYKVERDGEGTLTDNALLIHLRYDSSVTDDYKWRALARTALRGYVETWETTTSTTFADLATVGPTVTAPLAGVYEVRCGAHAGRNGGAGTYTASILYAVNGTTVASHKGADFASGLATGTWLHNTPHDETLAADDVVRLKYKSSNVGGTMAFMVRYLELIPIRVG